MIHAHLVHARTRLSPGLFDGQLGICLYLFHAGQVDEARAWLHEAAESLPGLQGNMRMADGLCGAGWAMHRLFAQGWLKGDLEQAVSEIDDALFRQQTDKTCTEKYTLAEIAQLIHYMALRWQRQKPGSETEFLFRKLINQTLGDLLTELTESGNRCEPPYYTLDYALPQALYALGNLLACEPFRQRILKAIRVLTPAICTVMPCSQGNRLYLLGAWERLLAQKEMQEETWMGYRNLLYHSINPDDIVLHEMGDSSIYLRDGVSSLYFLLGRIQEYKGRMNDFRKLFIQRIDESPEWDLLASNKVYARAHLGLYGGICGTAWAYERMKKEERSAL